jgi:hypothetical protein
MSNNFTVADAVCPCNVNFRLLKRLSHWQSTGL